MLKKRIALPSALLAAFLVLGLLLPQAASARAQTILGSLTITGVSPTDLVGIAVIHNPGFEKTITQQIPPLTVPVFVDVDKDDSSGGVLTSRFDTLVVLTNTTGNTLINITLTLLDTDGNQLATMTINNLGAHASRTINVSDLLP